MVTVSVLFTSHGGKVETEEKEVEERNNVVGSMESKIKWQGRKKMPKQKNKVQKQEAKM
jgi:hypothetical protein